MDDKEIKGNVELEKKKSFLNNKKTVSGKALSAWLITMIVIFMLFTFGLGVFLGKELFSEKKQSKNNEKEVVDNNKEENNTRTDLDTNDKSEVVDNSKEEKENNTRTYLDINDETVQKLFNIFRYDNEHCFLIGEALNSNNLARLRIAYNSLSENSKREMSCSSLIGVIKYNNNEISAYCGSHLNDEMQKYYVDSDEFEKAALTNTTTYVYAKDLQDKYNELFSSNYLYTNESFGWNIGLEPEGQFMKYYDDKGIYALYNCECGGICGINGHIINSAYKVGNSLFIETTLDQTKINYEFRLENGMYKFVKVVESK